MVKGRLTNFRNRAGGRESLSAEKATTELEPGSARTVIIQIPSPLCEGAKMGWQAMTGKISMKPDGDADRDFAAWADAWVDRNCHLPPGGDHSWREREARRIFGGNPEGTSDDGEDPPPVEEAGPAAREAEGLTEPGFKAPRTVLNFMLPVSLAAIAVLAGGFFLLPQDVKSGFWGSPESKVLSDMPVRMVSETAAKEKVTPILAYKDGSSPRNSRALSPAPSQQARQIVVPAKETAPPLLRPPVTERQAGKRPSPAARLAKAPAPAAKKRTAKSLPPIGEAYFARRALAAAAKEQIAVSAPPIGQAYFESHAPD
jgi:hypothetical protein